MISKPTRRSLSQRALRTSSQTQSRVRFWTAVMAGPNYRLSGTPLDMTEGRVCGGRSGFCFWILCQGWPRNVEVVTSREMDNSPSLGIWPGSQTFGVIVWEGKSPVFCLRSPSKRGIPDQSSRHSDWKASFLAMEKEKFCFVHQVPPYAGI